MILSFGSKATEKVWEGERVSKWPLDMQESGRRKLRMIHASIDIEDLRVPPGNRLEKLRGDLEDYYSIRINKQWRIIFQWEDGNALEVEIIDYH